jgi:hypothetical protein
MVRGVAEWAYRQIRDHKHVLVLCLVLFAKGSRGKDEVGRVGRKQIGGGDIPVPGRVSGDNMYP